MMEIRELEENKIFIFITDETEEESALEKAFELKEKDNQVAIVLSGDKEPDELFEQLEDFM